MTVIVFGLVSVLISIVSNYYLLVILKLGISSPIYAALLNQSIILISFFMYSWKAIHLFEGDLSTIKPQIKYGVPIALASLAQMVTEYADRIILNNFLSTNEVGIYSFGVRLAFIYNVLIVLPFAMIWEPMMMEYRKMPIIKKLFSLITSYYSILSICSVLFTYYFVEDLIGIFNLNIGYENSFKIVPSIMFGLFIYSLSNIFCAGIKYEKKTSILVYIYSVWGILNIIMNILIIKEYGILGAVFSGVICTPEGFM